MQYPSIHDIFTHLTIDEKKTLINLSKRCKGTIYVEIGSYLGASSCCIAEGIRKKKKKGILFCIDTWDNDAMTEGKRDTYNDFFKNTKKYSDIIIPIRGNSVGIGLSFDKTVDFIFFDGDHTYDGVKKDVDIWLPKLNPRAIIVMHDVGWAEGVQRIVKDTISKIALTEDRLPNMYWTSIK